jgi:hypothetical protein
VISIRLPPATPTVRAAARIAVASDPHVDGDAGRLDPLDQRIEVLVGHDHPGAVELKDQGQRPAVLRRADLGLDEVDQHAIQQSAHLDDAHVAGVGWLGGGGPRVATEHQHDEPEERGHQTGPG